MAHHSDKPFDGKNADQFREMIDGDRRPMVPGVNSPATEESIAAARRRLTRELLDTTGFKGAIGQHSQGKLTPSDEGDIQFRVGIEGEKVVLDFGTTVHWVGMDPQQAADLASSLMKWARLAGRKRGETITVNLGAT